MQSTWNILRLFIFVLHHLSSASFNWYIVLDLNTIRDFVLVADSYIQEIYRMDLETGSYSAIPQSAVRTPIAIDYDPLAHIVYYTDVVLHMIKSTKLDGTNEKILRRLNSGNCCNSMYIYFRSNCILSQKIHTFSAISVHLFQLPYLMA